jgi:hypothetical protein
MCRMLSSVCAGAVDGVTCVAIDGFRKGLSGLSHTGWEAQRDLGLLHDQLELSHDEGLEIDLTER